MNSCYESEILEAFNRELPKTPQKNLIRTPQKTPRTPLRSYRTPKTPSHDRFIPNRSNMDSELIHMKLSYLDDDHIASPSKLEFSERLASSIFDDSKPLNGKILSFKNKAPCPQSDILNPHRVLYSSNLPSHSSSSNTKKPFRYISSKPERILDAPQILDDYYLSLVDWSSHNIVAIGLSENVYLWNSSNGQASHFMTSGPNNHVTSVSWARDGKHISIGLDDGSCQIWDAETSRALRNLRGHSGRIGSISWNESKNILSTGSRDTSIHNHDIRIQQHIASTWNAHDEEVCGLKWNENGTLLASGGNDNLLCIWNASLSNSSPIRSSSIISPSISSPIWRFTDHLAAVKALAWCPWQPDLLASGGGTADRTLKFWNVTTGALLNSVDTHSQVSSIIWSKHASVKELVTSHGFSHNEMIVWKYPSLAQVSHLRSHEQRILSMAQSPDGERVVSASADETLRFWKIFDYEAKSNQSLSSGSKRVIKQVGLR